MVQAGFFNGAGGSWWEQQFWGGGQLLGHYDGSTTYFIHRSDVGSSSPTQITTGSGSLSGDETFYPWGQQWEYDNEANSWWQFYGGISRYQADLNLYLTPNRYYSTSYGRWLTPDPSGRAAVSLTNPQTWNMYAYALDNPTTLNDPSGLCSNASNYPCPVSKYTNNESSSVRNANHRSAKAVGSAQKQSDKKLAERLVMAGEAAVNIEILNIKISFAGALAATSPESGGATAVPAALIGISAAGNLAAAGVEAVGAITGKTQEAESLIKGATAAASPVGIVTLAATQGNMQKAARYAAWSGVLTTTPDNLLSGSVVEITAKVIDFVQNVKDAF